MLGFIGDRDGDAKRRAGALDASTIPGEDRSERLTGLDPVTGLGGDDEADAMVDGVLHLRPAAPHLDDRATERARLDTTDEAASRRVVDLDRARLRQEAGIIDDSWISALRFDDGPHAV